MKLNNKSFTKYEVLDYSPIFPYVTKIVKENLFAVDQLEAFNNIAYALKQVLGLDREHQTKFSYTDEYFGTYQNDVITVFAAVLNQGKVKMVHTFLHEFRHFYQDIIYRRIPREEIGDYIQTNEDLEYFQRICINEQNYQNKPGEKEIIVYYFQPMELDSNTFGLKVLKQYARINGDFKINKAIESIEGVMDAKRKIAINYFGQDYENYIFNNVVNGGNK